MALTIREPKCTAATTVDGGHAHAARHGRGHLTLHLPEGWRYEQEWKNLLAAACGPRAATA